MEKLKLAVVGGGIYGKNHLDCFKANPRVELVAICDLNEELAKKRAEEYGIKYYTSADEMFEKEDLDAISVATSDPYHKDPTLAAIKHGKHVLVEKPLATTSEDAYEIIEAASKANVRVMVDYHKRWDPASIALKNKLNDPKTGAPIRGYMLMDNTYDVATNWFTWSAKSSPVHFVGTHCIDIIRFFMDCEVTQVYAVGHKGLLKARGVDTFDSCTAILTFENGCTWTVENAWILPNGFAKNDDGRMELICANEMIRVDNQRRGVEYFDDQKGHTPNIYFMQEYQGKLIGFGYDPMNEFVDCILDNKPFRAGLKDGLEAELIAEAIHKSASTGQVVKIERKPLPKNI